MDIGSLMNNGPAFLPLTRGDGFEMRQMDLASKPEFVSLDESLPRPDSTLLSRQESFSNVMARASESEQNKDPETVAREASEQMVAINFIQPLLKNLRETSNAAPPFAPSDAEKQFRTLMDAQVSLQIVKASGFSLVERLASDMLKNVEKLREGREAMTSATPGREATATDSVLGGFHD